MKYVIIPVTPYQQNCTLMWCENTNKAAVVDPGGNLERIIEAVERHGVTVDKVLLTHGHLDHVGAAKQLAHHYGVEIIGPHEGDQFLLDDLPHQCQSFGFPLVRPLCQIIIYRMVMKWLSGISVCKYCIVQVIPRAHCVF